MRCGATIPIDAHHIEPFSALFYLGLWGIILIGCCYLYYEVTKDPKCYHLLFKVIIVPLCLIGGAYGGAFVGVSAQYTYPAEPFWAIPDGPFFIYFLTLLIGVLFPIFMLRDRYQERSGRLRYFSYDSLIIIVYILSYLVELSSIVFYRCR
jgi:hypothetical protein